MDVLAVDRADLRLGQQRVDRRDRIVVEVESPADVDIVVHSHDVQKDIDMVDQRTGGYSQSLPRRRRPGRLWVIGPLRALGPRGAERFVLDELQLQSSRRLAHVDVLGVAETGEDTVERFPLAGEADQIDVRVLAVHEPEIDAVAAYGQATCEPHVHAGAARYVDHRHGLGHEAIGKAARRPVPAEPRLQRLALGGLVGPAHQGFDGFLDGIEDGRRHVDARAAGALDLREPAAAPEGAHGATRRCVAHRQRPPHVAHGNERRDEELVHERLRRALGLGAVTSTLAEQDACLQAGALRRFADALGEEQQPRPPLAVSTHALQQGVVLAAVRLEIGGEIQERL